MKSECQLQKIKKEICVKKNKKTKNCKGLCLKKNDGKLEMLLPLFFILLIIPVIACNLQLSQIKATKATVEDALAASNLASAVIDIEEYGISNNIIIKDPTQAYEIYRDALKINLKLNDSWESDNKAYIAGQVIVESYIIYNVINTEDSSEIVIYEFDNNGLINETTIPNGGAVSPNGRTIESTSIYSKIMFPVEGIWGFQKDAVKDNLVDIVKND